MQTLSLLIVLAWRNLWRRRARTILILFALALGVWSMVCLAALARGSVEQQLTSAILNLTGHVQIHAPGYRDDPAIEHTMDLSAATVRALSEDPDVIAAGARVRVPAVISSERESAGVTLVGIDPAHERGLSFIPGAVIAGRYLDSPQDEGLLLGRKLAEQLETELGRRVVMMSQKMNNEIADRGFRVVGIFHTQPEAIETSYVFIGRTTTQRMLKLGERVSEVVLMTPDRNRLGPLVARLKNAAPDLDVQPWTAVEPLLVLTENITNVILIIWYAIVFAAMSFGLVNTLLMAVFERTREFGLFQALGMRPSHIVAQVLVESVLLLGVSLVLGNVAAAATLHALKDGIDLSAFAQGFEMIGISPILYPFATTADAIAANALVLTLGIVASLYPAWRAARFAPVQALARI